LAVDASAKLSAGSRGPGLDAECVLLRAQLAQSRADAASLLSATALLCGALYPLHRRAYNLAAQRDVLSKQLARFNTFKTRVGELASAMAFGGDKPTKATGNTAGVAAQGRSGRMRVLLRFRAAVIAVLAANRLWFRPSRSCRMFTVCFQAGIGPSTSVYAGRMTADTKHQFHS